MKKNSFLISLFLFCFLILPSNIANAGYIHSIQIGGDGNKETFEYLGDDKEDEKINQNTTINYNYITPVDYPPSYYDRSYYYPYVRSNRYSVITTYPMVPMYMSSPPPRHRLHHGHRPPPPMHRPPHRHHGHNRVHIGLPGVHVSF